MEITRDELQREVIRIGRDIVQSARFEKARRVSHHSDAGSVGLHSLNTAIYALYIARWLAVHGIAMSEVDIVRASLLHDIGMTEDEVFLSPSHVKAYSHPKEGARIAREEFGVNEVQADAILHHMWPIGHIPPHSREGWVVMMADKCCSMNEAREIAQSLVGRVLSAFDQTTESS